MRAPLTAVLVSLVAGSLLMTSPPAAADRADAAPSPRVVSDSVTTSAAKLPEFVIAGFGDSYGSGEGAPHAAGTYR